MQNFPLKMKAEFKSENLIVKDVYIEVRLPQKDKDEIFLDCFPTDEQFKKIIGKHNFSITGISTDDFNSYDKITIKEAIYMKFLPLLDLKNEEKYHIIFQCMDLYAEVEQNNSEEKDIEGHFYINLLASLSPNKVFDRKPSGIVKVSEYTTHKFNLDENFVISFDTKYFYDQEKQTKEQIENICYFSNIAEFNFNGNLNDIEHYSKLLNDFLMLMSFGIRKRVVHTGWVVNNNKKFILKLKRDIIVPEYKGENLLPNYLIEPNELNNFIRSSYKIFRELNHQDIIRRAIFPLLTEAKISTESQFLILFSCLESILSYHKKNKQFENIIEEEDFKSIRGLIQGELKDLFSNCSKNNISEKQVEILKKYDSNKRAMVYQKISELNRPSFKMILDDFCNEYSLDLKDLWSITESNQGISLTQIRNKLIHGDALNFNQHKSLIIAYEHLKTVVERMILKILEWDISKTRVVPSKIKNNLIFKEDVVRHMKLLDG